MDLHKLIPDVCEITKHGHLPLLAGFVGLVRFHNKIKSSDIYSDLGDVPGDNLLPREILDALISRGSL